ncbi:Uncharacterised protein [Mycobacteroides abscessus subsp. abscessus]|jgi:hypothetical protein|nr:Uncharacterised protein [Mycobacteroides abscessus subsp. abscessus]SUN00932.1 Uncharacterised protein [Staphylococcus warneri]VED32123.1 Uncharacterised protein [Staphylococcus warneri]VED74380.1 Uncharacterised protein [Staphylococcus warneri]
MYTYQLDGSCSINEMIDDLKENVKKESSEAKIKSSD